MINVTFTVEGIAELNQMVMREKVVQAIKALVTEIT